MSKTPEPRYIWKPKYDKDDGKHYKVSVARESDDQYGEPLCEVTDYGERSRWQITATTPDDYLPFVRYTKFDTKEQAVHFFHALHRKAEAVTTSRPLPDDVGRYLDDRARELQEDERRALDLFRKVRFERFALLRFAERNQLTHVKWKTEDTDAEATLRAMLEFKVFVEDDGQEVEVPFFSETALYNLIGKDAARTVLGMVRRVCEGVSPRVTEECL